MNINNFEINRYFIRWQDGRLAESEKIKLETWLKEPSNRDAWEKLNSIWRVASPFQVPQRLPVEEQWKVTKNRLSANENRKFAVHKPKRAYFAPRYSLKFASAFIILAILFSAYNFYFKFENIKTVSVPFGQQINLTLSDGSQIHLNAGSTIKYPDNFTSDIRRVELIGEAYFKVQRGQKPFVVETARTQTRVLGTEFNVRTWDSATEVFVTLGRVAVQSKIAVQAPVVEILPGQMAICKDGPISVQPTKNPGDVLSWRHGRLVFINRPLDSIASELQRKFDIRISLEPNLQSHTVSATFEDESIEEIIGTIAKVINAKVKTIKEGDYYISSN